jgi:hypothetical protein
VIRGDRWWPEGLKIAQRGQGHSRGEAQPLQGLRGHGEELGLSCGYCGASGEFSADWRGQMGFPGTSLIAGREGLGAWDGSTNDPRSPGSSPHLVQVRERIRINGQPISPELFTKHFWRLYHRLEETKVPVPEGWWVGRAQGSVCPRPPSPQSRGCGSCRP